MVQSAACEVRVDIGASDGAFVGLLLMLLFRDDALAAFSILIGRDTGVTVKIDVDGSASGVKAVDGTNLVFMGSIARPGGDMGAGISSSGPWACTGVGTRMGPGSEMGSRRSMEFFCGTTGGGLNDIRLGGAAWAALGADGTA